MLENGDLTYLLKIGRSVLADDAVDVLHHGTAAVPVASAEVVVRVAGAKNSPGKKY